MKRITKKLIATFMAVLMVFGAIVSAPIISGQQYGANLVRMGGQDRFQTADWIANEGWDMSSSVILANGLSFPDALAGAPLAYALDAPILLVDGKQLSPTVRNRIQALGASRVYILGGSSAVSNQIESELKSKNYTVERIWGQNRYDTAVAVAEKLKTYKSTPREVFIVSGLNYPDALAVGPVAALKGVPVLYADPGGSLPRATSEFIASTGATTAYIIGGPSAVSESVNANLRSAGILNVSRTYGSSRYETSVQVAETFADTFPQKNIAFATGKNYPDALAGGVFAAKHGAPLLLTDINHTAYTYGASGASSVGMTAYAAPSSTGHALSLVDYVAKINPENVYIFGGQNVLPDYVIQSYLPVEEPQPEPEPEPTTCSAAGTVYTAFEPVVSNNISKYGDPIGNVSIVFMAMDGNSIDLTKPVTTYRASTNSKGKFTLDEIQPGSYMVRLQKEGYETSEYKLEITKAGSMDLKLFLYGGKQGSGTVSGTVTCNNEPVGGATVYLCYRSGNQIVATSVSDNNGKFSFDVAPGSYMVYASGNVGYQALSNEVPVVVQSGKTSTASLVFPYISMESTIKGVLLQDGQYPLPDLPVTFTNKSTGERYQTASNSNGSFTLKNMPAGDYRVDVNVTMTDDGELFQFLGSIDTVTVQPMQTLNMRVTVRVIRKTYTGGDNDGTINWGTVTGQ